MSSGVVVLDAETAQELVTAAQRYKRMREGFGVSQEYVRLEVAIDAALTAAQGAELPDPPYGSDVPRAFKVALLLRDAKVLALALAATAPEQGQEGGE